MDGALLMARCAANHRESGGGSGHKHWRLYVTDSHSFDTFRLMLAEFKLINSLAVDVATGGTATASSTFGDPFLPSAAFDKDINTSFATTAQEGNAGGLPQWLAYELPASTAIVSATIVSSGSSTRAARSPKSFQFQYSDDGATWTTIKTVTGVPAWGISESRNYIF